MKEYSGESIIMMANSDCNAKCKHCYINYKGNFEGQDLRNLVAELQKRYDVSINGSDLKKLLTSSSPYDNMGSFRVIFGAGAGEH